MLLHDRGYSDGGKGEVKTGAVIQFAGGADRSVVSVDDVFRDRKAEPRAAGFAGTRFIDAIKALEEPGQMFRSDSLAEVANIEFDIFRVIPRADDDPIGARRVFECVVNEVGENLVDGVPIGPHDAGSVVFNDKRDAACL